MRKSMNLTMSLAALALAITGGGLGCLSGIPGHGGGGGSGGTGSGGSGGCSGLQCQQQTCPGGVTTNVSGKVFAPNGTLPLYNAIVYVPNDPPAAFTDGVTCDRCNGSVSGSPIAIAQTDATGSFTLTNVPVGNNIPLVIQMGKWRQQLTVPSVASCQTTMLPATMTKLPSKSGPTSNMPKMAIASGSADPFECLLLKVGIDPSEITAPSGNGRVHFYLGTTKPGTSMPGAVSAGNANGGLFASLQKMLGYDVIMLPCEGTNNYQNTTNTQRDQLTKYLDAGGRVFSTHFSYQWLTYTASPYNSVGNWNVDQPQPCGNATTCGYIATLDTSFPKGMSFSSWLSNVSPGVSGSFEISDPRNDLDGVNAMYGQRWAYHQQDSKIQHMTFNTPLNPPKDAMGNPQYCGRVVFSDFHVSANEAMPGVAFPGACKGGALTTQEKALAFMLFDLSSCVQSDQQPPIP